MVAGPRALHLASERAAAPSSRKPALTLEMGGERLDLETDCDVDAFLLLAAG